MHKPIGLSPQLFGALYQAERHASTFRGFEESLDPNFFGNRGLISTTALSLTLSTPNTKRQQQKTNKVEKSNHKRLEHVRLASQQFTGGRP